MEKYRYVIQSGILFLLCILQVYSNFGIYKDYSKNNKDPNITKKRKQILIAFSILSVILAIWFISEIIHVIELWKSYFYIMSNSHLSSSS